MASRPIRLVAAAVALVLGTSLAVLVPAAAPGGAAPIGGCQMFPSNTFWHADISRLSRHPQSNAWINEIGAGRGLKMDFGSGLYEGNHFGIPYLSVPNSQPNVPVVVDWYPEESDQTWPYPIPLNAPIEGAPAADGDAHVLVVEQGECRLHELYAARPGASSWTAGSAAQWDLDSYEYRGEPGFTSADAAGLPVLAPLVRYDEAVAGTIDHPLRITVHCTADAYVWPARHEAGDDNSCPPMGAWLRLRHTVDTSGFSPVVQNILEALKTHGAIVADNGTAWYVSGEQNPDWDNDDLNDTNRFLEGADLEFVDVSTIRVDGGAGATMRYQDRGQRFIDVPPGASFFTEIGWLETEGITTGFPDLTFRPVQSVTRQATVAFLYRMAGEPAGSFPNPGFSDVQANHPFFREIAWAVQEDVADGYTNNTFRPGNAVSRQAMAAFLYGFLDGASDPTPPNPGFSDVSTGNPFFTQIAWLVDAEIADGYSNGTFRPSTAISRQAMAAFLYRSAP
jgi:hypothetical protein